MNVLFIHQNFPAQFVHLSGALAREKGNRVVALAQRRNPAPDGVEVRQYTLLREPAQDVHPLLREEEVKVMRAEAVAAAAFALKHDGFVPDVMVAHPGWGEALFIKDVFPQAKLVVYCEYYYAAEGQDVGFDPEMEAGNLSDRMRLILRNSVALHSLSVADLAISPTEWQRNTFPVPYRSGMKVVHDGIDYSALQFNDSASITVNRSVGPLDLTPADEVLTFVSRSLEPVRGFHIFMRMLPELLRQRPNLHVLVVGQEQVSYGHPPSAGGTWKQVLTQELPHIDFNRTHFLGQISYSEYLKLLSVSSVHTHWTTPFVLSWSLLEAAASGLPTIASSTQPVLEFARELDIITNDFFDQKSFVDSALSVLANPRRKTRRPRYSERIDRKVCVERLTNLIHQL